MFKNYILTWSVENGLPSSGVSIRIEGCNNLTSLDGIEEIRVSEWQYIGDLTISQCPNLTDISALKEID